jgi:hypothetical protein
MIEDCHVCLLILVHVPYMDFLFLLFSFCSGVDRQCAFSILFYISFNNMQSRFTLALDS